MYCVADNFVVDMLLFQVSKQLAYAIDGIFALHWNLSKPSSSRVDKTSHVGLQVGTEGYLNVFVDVTY